MTDFKSVRWSPKTEISEANMQAMADNDTKLYEDLTRYSIGFAMAEIKEVSDYDMTFFGAPSGMETLYYTDTGVSLDLVVPQGTRSLIFGCYARSLYLDQSAANKSSGFLFAAKDTDGSTKEPNYALFAGVPAVDNFNQFLSGKALYTPVVNTQFAEAISISIFVWATATGSVTVYGTEALPSQFWVMCVGDG
jgi:hypothetical protein